MIGKYKLNKSTPFINSYLKEYKNNNKIKKILDSNKCKIIPYSKITKDIKIDNYDIVIIVGKNELKRIVKNDKNLYKNHKNKLFFIGDYYDSYYNYNDYKNILHKIKIGLNIYVCKKYKYKIVLSNLIQNISLNDKDYKNQFILSERNNTKYILNNLSSSIKQIDINLTESRNILSNNIPNKVKIINTSTLDNKKIKLPKDIILLININSNNNMKIKNIKNNMKIKTKISFIKIREISEWSGFCNFDTVTKMIIKKGNKNSSVLVNYYTYDYDMCYKSNIHLCKSKIQEDNDYVNIWKIISGNFIEYSVYRKKNHYMNSFDKNVKLLSAKSDNKILEFVSNNFI